MVLVPILGEAFLDIKDYLGTQTADAAISGIALFSGFMTAFITGCIACKWMINIVKKGKINLFCHLLFVGSQSCHYLFFCLIFDSDKKL